MSESMTQNPKDVQEPAISRRSMLSAGAGIAASLTLGRASAQHHSHASPEASPVAEVPPTPQLRGTRDVGGTGADLVQPEVRESVDGVLETTLHASWTQVAVNGQTKVTRVFEGMYPAPTLVSAPGETIRIHLINDLPEVTNLHTHGFHVSPSGNSDNVFVEIQPGETFDFEFNLPEDHTPGMYWYHPHVHGTTGVQVNGGLAGAIILKGGLDDLPELQGIKDRVMIFQSTEFDSSGVVRPTNQQNRDYLLRTINGQRQPTIRMRPGEIERWRMLNATSGSFLLMALEGHQLHQIAHDGNPLTHVVSEFQLMMGPGERNEVIVEAGAPGVYEFRQLLWGEGIQSQPDVLWATVIVEGEPVDPQPMPTTLFPFVDLRDVEVDVHREVRFDMLFDDDGVHFVIDGRTVDMNRVDQTVRLNDVEEWTIYNDSDEWHPFHIHINEFQVVAVNGEPYDAVNLEDTRPLPPNGSITMRTQFLDFTGKYVYHCHILGHEDAGMMGIIEVVD